MSNKPSDFPSELVTPVANIQSSLKNLNNILDNSQKQSLQELTEKNNLDSIGIYCFFMSLSYHGLLFRNY